MKKNAIIIVLIVAVLLGLGIYLAGKSPEVPVQKQADSNIKGEAVPVRSNSHMTGKIDAKVTLVEFGDFQCPYCAQAYKPVKDIVDKYKSNPNFNYVFREYPLPAHPNAPEAAEAAEAAGAQGKFWEMHDLLYEHQNDWSGSLNPTDTFVGYAQQVGLDVNRFKSEMLESKYVDQIAQDQKDADALGILGPPSFYINGQPTQLTDLDKSVGDQLSKIK